MALSAEQAFIEQYSRRRPRPIGGSHLAEWRLRAACRTSTVEFFPPDNLRGAALRRLEADAKSVCADCPVRRTCLQYALDNGEPHGIRRRANQKDYTRRLQEFFDHFLKGTPAPEWMEKGIPYLQREKEKEKYRTSEDNP